MPKKEEKKKRRIPTLILIGGLIALFVMGTYFGFVLGIQYSAKSYIEVLRLVFENSDVKMTVNMTLNQTEMMDYMLDKMGVNNGTITKKEYIPPCNMDPNIPRGETGQNTSMRCIEPQVDGVKYNFSLAR